MFDIGFSEILLIVVAALVFIAPKDLPVVLRHVMKVVREFRTLYSGLKTQMHTVMEEAGLHDLHQDIHNQMTTIIDLEGKPQKAYNVADLRLLESTSLQEELPPVMTPLDVPPPIGGRLGGGLPHTAPSEINNELLASRQPPPQPSPDRGGSELVMTPLDVPISATPSPQPSPARGEGDDAAPLHSSSSTSGTP